MSAEFCDTNVLVYAYDESAGAKQEQASTLVARLWQEGSGVVSVQVLQELYVTLTRKARPPLSSGRARQRIAALLAWTIVEPGRDDVLEAIDGSERWQLSFWDAMLVTTARRAGAAVLWSEDLNDGQTYGDVTVRNPFVPSTPRYVQEGPKG